MSEEPKSFWGKLGMITAFLSALAGVATLTSKCTETEPRIIPSYYVPQATPNYTSPSYPVQPATPNYSTPSVGNFCCDIMGNRWCQLWAPAVIGSACFCVGQGTGITCP